MPFSTYRVSSVEIAYEVFFSALRSSFWLIVNSFRAFELRQRREFLLGKPRILKKLCPQRIEARSSNRLDLISLAGQLATIVARRRAG
jgi:hypothetical protein